MNYREFPPIHGLEDYVECAWLLEQAPGHRLEWHRVFPDEHIDIAFGFGERLLRKVGQTEKVVLHPGACVIGQQSGPLWLKPTGIWRTAGLCLRPEGAFAILDMNLSEIANDVLPLEDLWGRAGREMVDRFLASPSPELALYEIQRTFRDRLHRTRRPHPATVRAARMIVKSGGIASIRRVARDVGWSERTLQRRFTQEIGASPKSLLRTVRFHRLISEWARVPHESWATLACDCGYSDQAHLVREVREFAGCPPGQLDEDGLDIVRLLRMESSSADRATH